MPHLQRKLTAIFYADVVDYSRLTGRDEEGAHRLLSEHMDSLTAAIDTGRGHVVHFAGDAVLAEFSSIVDALSCAVEAQRALGIRNRGLDDDHKLRFRIGVNLGDVIVDRDDIYGDGVNVAARLESLAEPGGVCISAGVYEQVRHKLPLDYQDLGPQRVKNIADPVHAYRVLLEPRGRRRPGSRKPAVGRRKIVIAAIVIGVATLAIAGTYFLTRFSTMDSSPALQEDTLKTDAGARIPLWSAGNPIPILPRKPAIAVLPFTNLGADATQEYFSDGVTNDIITNLSKFQDLFVIASHTMFTYKGQPVNVRDLNRQLGVRYVLEGSVQRRGERLRISARLLDAVSGHHLWAERYDRESRELFAVQDDIIQRIVGTLAVKIDRLERERALRKDTANLEAHDYAMRGWEYYRRKTRATNHAARRMFQQAAESDPRYASAHAGMGLTHLRDFWFGWTEFPDRALNQAGRLAEKALAIDETNTDAHFLLGYVYLYRRQYDLAIAELERAIEINPNDAESFFGLAYMQLWSSRLDEAIETFETGFQLDPSVQVGRRALLALAYYLKGDYLRSIRILERNLSHKPDEYPSYIYLTAAYARAGRQRDAKRTGEKLLRLQPFFQVESFRLFRDPAHNEAVAEGLRKAGLK